jgi:hypothetical protein
MYKQGDGAINKEWPAIPPPPPTPLSAHKFQCGSKQRENVMQINGLSEYILFQEEMSQQKN